MFSGLIPDFWLQQSVHWETRLGFVGPKRLLAKNNPNQRNETSKVTPHLTEKDMDAINSVWLVYSTLQPLCLKLSELWHLHLRDFNLLSELLNIMFNCVCDTLYVVHIKMCTVSLVLPVDYQRLWHASPSEIPYLSLQCGTETRHTNKHLLWLYETDIIYCPTSKIC